MSTYVLTHGAWGGGWVWSRLAPLLRAAGQPVYTPTLTGMAERSHLLSPDLGLTTHIDDIVNLIEWEQLDDVVLVGHSYGGMVTTGVLARVPERIERMVYVDAYAPVIGQCCFDILPGMREPAKAMAAASDGQYVDPFAPALLGVEDPEQAAWIEAWSTRMPYAPLEQPLPGDGALADRPTTYVSCTKLGLFAESAVAVRERGWALAELDTHHFPQIAEPAALAEIVLAST